MANMTKRESRPVTFKMGKFLRESRAELRKVTWPNRKELITYTTVVIVATGIAAVFLGVVDLIFSQLIGLLERHLRGARRIGEGVHNR